MIEKFEEVRKQLSDLATVLNEFKSEAVQLRILEFVLQENSTTDEEEPTGASGQQKPKGRTRKAATKPDETQTSEKRKRGAVGTGAPATLLQLLSGNFFDHPRTINDIIEHCKHNLARTFRANEFSGKLGRMVRKGQLNRNKNADKQYEYKKP